MDAKVYNTLLFNYIQFEIEKNWEKLEQFLEKSINNSPTYLIPYIEEGWNKFYKHMVSPKKLSQLK